MKNEKIGLRKYVETKFKFLSEDHQNMLIGLMWMMNGTMKDIENARIMGRYTMLKHTLSMAGFPVRRIFMPEFRFDSKWKTVELP
jgi:hypothetical protein